VAHHQLILESRNGCVETFSHFTQVSTGVGRKVLDETAVPNLSVQVSNVRSKVNVQEEIILKRRNKDSDKSSDKNNQSAADLFDWDAAVAVLKGTIKLTRISSRRRRQEAYFDS